MRACRTLALTLQDDAVRLRLKNDLDGSHFREHKLHAARYLRGDAGKALRGRLASKRARGDADVDAILNSIRSVELYMPVPEHKLTWDGGPDVIVAAQLREGAPIVGFRLDGSQVKLSADSVPSTPTLVLVSVETDFDHPMTNAQVHAADKQLRARATLMPPTAQANMGKSPGVSAMIVPCDECGGGGGGVQLPPQPDGVYANSMNVRDAHEPWTRGDPELEIHTYGTQNGKWYPYHIPGGYGLPDGWAAQFTLYAFDYIWMDCAGEHAADSRFFDFNNNGTQVRPYPILIAETSNFAYRERVTTDQAVLLHDRRAPLQAPFLIKIIERDDGNACPEPPHKFDPTFGIQLTYSPNGWENVRPYHTSSVKEIVNWLFGNNNDLVSQWTISSFASFEQANNMALTGGDADLTISSHAFSRYAIPAEITYYP